MSRLIDFINKDKRFKFIELFCGSCKPYKSNEKNILQECFSSSSDANGLCLSNKPIAVCKRNYDLEYILFPNVINPRWIVKNNRQAIKNLGFLVKPTTRLARYIWVISLLLNKIGLFGAIYRSRLYIKNNCFENAICSVLNDSNVEISAVYTGARSAEAKFVVQITKSDIVEYYCKVGISSAAVREIEYERKVIKKLVGAFEVIKLPDVINNTCHAYKNYELLIMKNLADDGADVDLSLSSLDTKVFVELLESGEVHKTKLSELFRNLEFVSSISSKISLLKLYGDAKIVFSYGHGDYIPWNRILQKDNVIVLDWERYGYYPVFYDHVNFIVHVSALIKKDDERECLNLLQKQVKMLISVCNSKRVKIGEDELGIYIVSSLLYIYGNYAKNINYKEDVLVDYIDKLIVLALQGE